MSNQNQSSNLSLPAIVNKLNYLETLLDDLTPVMTKIAGRLEADSEDAFENEWNPSTHEKWVELQDSTIKQRTKEGKWPGKMLQVSGELASRLTSDYGDKFARVGIKSGQGDYAKAMQFGRPDKNIPARPYLPFDGLHPDVETDILEILDEAIQHALG